MDFSFIGEAVIVLSFGYCLLRLLGKKTVGEMTGVEIITLLAMASMIGHAVKGDGLLRTLITLCIFVTLLLTIQFLAIRFNWVEKWFVGRSTVVIEDGVIVEKSLKKLRLTVDQLEAKLRTKGITSFSEVKTATIEMSGHIGYELARHAKPVTIGELERIMKAWNKTVPKQPQKEENLFDEVKQDGHRKKIAPHLE
ncbi:hypothetical protein BBG47_05700 [Paenibacillus sp. KS1]|uniref:DUF421 domain-containing protein n=1 Tax=Paenibacillus sp. KS1 TaxID=1849249 RepID=UPI0008066448|nr:YetF domain-containing protein [Paenibacillus sp. KS1]OBY80515.1 hypothetical protein BBG47_05700 [Paenibacillus sp. KS1]